MQHADLVRVAAVQFDRFLVRIAAEIRAFDKADSQGRPAAGGSVDRLMGLPK